jgi:hypothetical protein
MKQIVGLSLLTLFLTVSSEARDFKHPGMMSTQEGLATLKNRVESNPCAKLGYEQLKKSDFANLSRPHTPYPVVYVASSAGNKYEAAFRGDAQAAHATALMWVITGDTRYRDKAMSILNDWAVTNKDIKLAEGDANPPQPQLEAAWAVPIWIAAADIIRYYDQGAAGWPPECIAAFDQFLDRMVTLAREARHHSNNWATSATLAIMAAAVYQNDAAAYAEAVELYKQHLSFISKPSGALGPDYLRDPWHPQYTVLTWMQTCEIAWNQGDDLYGITLDEQSEPRLALCLEHFSRLFLGELPDPQGLKKGNYRDSQKERQGYDIGYNHYICRKNMESSLPFFAKMVSEWRPGEIDDHFMAWDTLTHGELSCPK